MAMVLSNTLSGKKEQFSTIVPNEVKLYVCGITPYDYAHVGHGRCYVTFDVLYRLLRLTYSKVTYCRNFTDIDDKLLDRAERELGDRYKYSEVAQKFIDSYTQDVKNLNCLSPDVEPLVTGTIPEIIEHIEKLIQNKYAYAVDGDVYYRVTKFADYGKLSKRKLEDLLVGARVEINTKKENPLDFALWKSEPENTFWKSPWGFGRPGWHIECSAMAQKYLGEHIDIHGGGMDLIFPHHENEIAQSEAASGKQFVNYWVHHNFLTVEGQKMSKSIGNIYTVEDVVNKGFDPIALRYLYLQTHYRQEMNFTWEALEASQKAYYRLRNEVAGFDKPGNEAAVDYDNKFFEAIGDDLNMPKALGVLWEMVKSKYPSSAKAASILKMDEVLGLNLTGVSKGEKIAKVIEVPQEVMDMVKERELLRKERRFHLADQVRNKIIKLGYDVTDKEKGVTEIKKIPS